MKKALSDKLIVGAVPIKIKMLHEAVIRRYVLDIEKAHNKAAQSILRFKST